jgi:flagellin
MALRIVNNIAALNTQRWLGVADVGMKKSLERLSSGYRINRAADDAAGLAISQSFRADIASFKVASRNTSEASSLLQVAEGGMDQIGNMLTRLKELATQASSANAGANLDKINSEGNAIIDEMDRIAASTEYAGSKLLNGTFGVSLSTGSFTATLGMGGVTGLESAITYTVVTLSTSATEASMTISATIGSGQTSQTLYGITSPGAGNTTDLKFAALGLTLTLNDNFEDLDANDGTLVASTATASDFQVGAQNTGNDRIGILITGVTTSDLSITKDQLSAASTAQTFLDTINSAIGTLAGSRGDIGAAMNRLTYASANLAATIENVQAAESVIRDVDMAAEMTDFTKNQILLQAGTAMLAQANMAPQQVLALFG